MKLKHLVKKIQYDLLNLLPVNTKLKMMAKGQPLDLTFSEIKKIHASYRAIEKKLLQRMNQGKKIRVGFVVNIPSVFTMRPVFELMQKSENFASFIVTVPMVGAISKEFGINNCEKSYELLSKQYQNVLNAYDKKNDAIIDYTDRMDIAVLATSDEIVMPEIYKIYNLVLKGILTCYQNYTWLVSNDNNHKSGGYLTDSFSLFWKVFTESMLHEQDIEKHSKAKGINSVVTGYVKIDEIAKYTPQKRNKKLIIIAPHHSIHEVGLCSRFLYYADFFLKLPKMYSNVDFVFRPHPNLIPTLKIPSFWGEEKTHAYFDNLLQNPNVTLDEKAEYYDLFVNSDGMIHDCGSFLPEYMITGKPECYLLKDSLTAEKYFNSFGQECLKQCYQAFKQEDIIDFIDKVIIEGNDSMQIKRKKFISQNLLANDEKISSRVITEILQSIRKE